MTGTSKEDIIRRSERLEKSGRKAAAVEVLEQAAAASPADPELRFALIRLYSRIGELTSALVQVEALPGEVRKRFDVGCCEAALLGGLGRHDQEIALYEALLATDSSRADVWMSYGNALKTIGRAGDAIQVLRRSIAIQPTFGDAWLSLSNLKTFRFDDSDVGAMRKALNSPIRPLDALHIHFALGKALEDRGEFDESFAHYDSGNRIRAGQVKPDLNPLSKLVDRSIASLDRPLFDRLAGAGHPSSEPIFVIGLQRSGSTLVEQILASHPLIEGTMELIALPRTLERFAAKSGGPARDIVTAVRRASPEILQQLGVEYLERARSFRLSGRPKFVDKLPANWAYAGLIRLILPNARIIDARRHPMACGFSIYKQHFPEGVSFCRLETIGRAYAEYVRLMNHLDRVQPGAIHRIINERLIVDPEGEVRRMFDYLDIPFDPACLEFHENKRAVRTPSAEQVRKGISREGVDQWRHYEQWLGPLKQALGPALDQWDKPQG